MRSTTWISLPILVSLAVFASPARAQFDLDGLGRLREFLSLPRVAIIKVSYRTLLPEKRPLRISIVTDPEPRGLSMRQITARAEVERFVATYNKRNGKGTQLEVVQAIEQADVILIHFEAVEKRELASVNRDMSDPRSSIMLGRGPVGRLYRSEIRGYVVIREGDDYTVIDDYQLSVLLDGRRFELRNLLERALRLSQR